ncbi:protein BUNDLE SHEATH DEFECTIVE 2, chloroplastic isoform X2 [Lactuca sativa]|uniref:protein BUNDLE SHEATH DEFECTIVE 2, chloroplastic isoform X2 n=1 Tax=Lactuca sativa TaxID=4236 RepID=UPI000CD94834|nr:protein BUNDLE SHEATH DEFECTIVE 2, chloroplastic isoform X2 [Lactuca sativa]
MTNSLCFTPLSSFKTRNKPGIIGGNPNSRKVIWVTNQNLKFKRFHSLEAKATDDAKNTTKVNSIVCGDCDGNGAIQCTQCEGKGVNTKDHFNGQFKAGGLCWLCRKLFFFFFKITFIQG